VAVPLGLGAVVDDRGADHPDADGVAGERVRCTGIGEPLVDEPLLLGRGAQPAAALGVVDPGQPGVEPGPVELDGIGRARRVIVQQALHACSHPVVDRG
jgi:hypothetical protein